MRSIFVAMMLVLGCTIATAEPTTSANGRQKMSSWVKRLSTPRPERKGLGGRSLGERPFTAEPSFLCAFVRATDVEALRENGCHVLASFNDIHIASIPLTHLSRLAMDKRVLRIEAKSSLTGVTSDTSVTSNTSLTSNTSFSGPTSPASIASVAGIPSPQKDVILGIMDIGFDLTHPMFRGKDGKTCRIKALWDMLDLTDGGMPVEGKDTVYVGRQYAGEEAILAKAHSYDGYIATHGTHTLGTAAGRLPEDAPVLKYEGESLVEGMAPDADICLVANAASENIDSIPEKNRYMYTSALDVLGFKYLFDYATAQGRPCVVSFSEGYHPDFSGDDILMAEVLGGMLGEGRILCASAGNESLYKTYMRIQGGTSGSRAPVGAQASMLGARGAFVNGRSSQAYYTLQSSGALKTSVTFYPDGKERVVKDFIITSNGLTYGDKQFTFDAEEMEEELIIVADTFMVADAEHAINIAVYPSCYDDSKMATELLIERFDKKIIGGGIPISIVLADNGDCTAEIFGHGGYFKSNVLDPELADAVASHNILNPGGMERIICVGSTNSAVGFHNYKDEWKSISYGPTGDISSFSSVGPTLDGRVKPDVVAPGSPIISSISSFYCEKNERSWNVCSADYYGRTYYWGADCGTSMSCPMVAGIIVNWMNAYPRLTPEQAMEVIGATSTRVDDTLPYPNNVWGYGVINAEAGLAYVMENYVTGIKTITIDDDSNGSLIYDLMGRKVISPRRGEIYIRKGKKFIAQSPHSPVSM